MSLFYQLTEYLYLSDLEMMRDYGVVTEIIFERVAYKNT